MNTQQRLVLRGGVSFGIGFCFKAGLVVYSIASVNEFRYYLEKREVKRIEEVKDRRSEKRLS